MEGVNETRHEGIRISPEKFEDFLSVRASSGESHKTIKDALEQQGHILFVAVDNYTVYLGRLYHKTIINAQGLNGEKALLEGHVTRDGRVMMKIDISLSNSRNAKFMRDVLGLEEKLHDLPHEYKEALRRKIFAFLD